MFLTLTPLRPINHWRTQMCLYATVDYQVKSDLENWICQYFLSVVIVVSVGRSLAWISDPKQSANLRDIFLMQSKLDRKKNEKMSIASSLSCLPSQHWMQLPVDYFFPRNRNAVFTRSCVSLRIPKYQLQSCSLHSYYSLLFYGGFPLTN